MSETKGHRERVRQRFLNEGLAHFQDYELLEFLLMFSLPRIDTKPIAKNLMRHFGSLYRVLEAAPQDLMKVQGVGTQSALLISSLTQLFRRYELDRWKVREKISTTFDLKRYIGGLFLGERYEVSRTILLDNAGGVLHQEEISRGTIDQVMIYARNVAELALRHGSKIAVIAHNHPGGTPHPSASDIEVTRSVKQAMEAIGGQLLDHYILAQGEVISLAQYTGAMRSPAARTTEKKGKGGQTPPWVEDDEAAAEKNR